VDLIFAAEPSSSLSFLLALLIESFLQGMNIVTIEVPEPVISPREFNNLLIFHS